MSRCGPLHRRAMSSASGWRPACRPGAAIRSAVAACSSTSAGGIRLPAERVGLLAVASAILFGSFAIAAVLVADAVSNLMAGPSVLAIAWVIWAAAAATVNRAGGDGR